MQLWQRRCEYWSMKRYFFLKYPPSKTFLPPHHYLLYEKERTDVYGISLLYFFSSFSLYSFNVVSIFFSCGLERLGILLQHLYSYRVKLVPADGAVIWTVLNSLVMKTAITVRNIFCIDHSKPSRLL